MKERRFVGKGGKRSLLWLVFVWLEETDFALMAHVTNLSWRKNNFFMGEKSREIVALPLLLLLATRERDRDDFSPGHSAKIRWDQLFVFVNRR